MNPARKIKISASTMDQSEAHDWRKYKAVVIAVMATTRTLTQSERYRWAGSSACIALCTCVAFALWVTRGIYC
jgi:hypothetical protein